MIFWGTAENNPFILPFSYRKAALNNISAERGLFVSLTMSVFHLQANKIPFNIES